MGDPSNQKQDYVHLSRSTAFESETYQNSYISFGNIAKRQQDGTNSDNSLIEENKKGEYVIRLHLGNEYFVARHYGRYWFHFYKNLLNTNYCTTTDITGIYLRLISCINEKNISFGGLVSKLVERKFLISN